MTRGQFLCLVFVLFWIALWASLILDAMADMNEAIEHIDSHYQAAEPTDTPDGSIG